MPQRTFDEIQADAKQANGVNDTASLKRYVAELLALNTPHARAAAHNYLGNVAMHTGDYPSALEYYRRALAAHEELGDRAGMAGVSVNMGIIYSVTGNYPSALERYGQALAVYDALGDRAGGASATAGMGTVFASTGNYPSALEYMRRAMATHEEIGDRAGVATAMGNIGLVYSSTGDYQSALEHYRHALAKCEALDDHIGAAYVLGNMIRTLINLELYHEAAALLERQASLQMNTPVLRAEHMVNRSMLAKHQDSLDEAQHHLQAALTICIEAGLRDASAECHERLRDLAQARNDFADYIYHNNEYLRITEEIRGKEATQRLTMMEAERKMEGERRERDKERALLYGALPKSVADRMIRGDDVSGDHFDQAAVMFLDIVGFTTHTSDLPPGDVVKLLEHIFSTIDGICETHNVIKIKTIGDSYLCFRGDADAATNARSVANVGLDIIHVASGAASGVAFMWPHGGRIQFRVGIHMGSTTAGVIGTQRLQYDVWGDTVNVASRLEGTSEPGRIHVSEAFAEVLRSSTDPAPYTLIQRGEVEIKGKGSMTTYWLEGA